MSLLWYALTDPDKYYLIRKRYIVYNYESPIERLINNYLAGITNTPTISKEDASEFTLNWMKAFKENKNIPDIDNGVEVYTVVRRSNYILVDKDNTYKVIKLSNDKYTLINKDKITKDFDRNLVIPKKFADYF